MKGLTLKPIPFPGVSRYLAGSDGHVYSTVVSRTPRKLLGTLNAAGYLVVDLSMDDGSVWKRKPVHRFICMAFSGPPPSDRPWARHLDDVKTNNVPANLAWGSSAENSADMVRNGGAAKGERNGDSRVSDAEHAEILRRIKGGEKHRVIAAEFKVSMTTVSKWRNAAPGMRA